MHIGPGKTLESDKENGGGGGGGGKDLHPAVWKHMQHALL